MGFIAFIALLIVCSGVSLTLRVLGLGFRLFWWLITFAITLLGYLIAGAIAFAMPVLAIIILAMIFTDKR